MSLNNEDTVVVERENEKGEMSKKWTTVIEAQHVKRNIKKWPFPELKHLMLLRLIRI